MAKSIQFTTVVVATGSLLLFPLHQLCRRCKNPKDLVRRREGVLRTCRIEFKTKLSEPIAGSTVALKCRTRDDGEVVYSHEVSTDKNGEYRIPAQSGHAELICEVHLVKSPNPECNQVNEKLSRARILLSTNVGVVEPVGHANSLRFMRNEAFAGFP